MTSELILTRSTNERAVTDQVTGEYQAGHEPQTFLPVLVEVVGRSALRFVPSEMNGQDSPLAPQVPGVMRIQAKHPSEKQGVRCLPK